jgi:hypothetical protein
MLVLDIRNNEPVAGAKITLQESTLETDADGLAEFLDVPPGLTSLRVQKEGFDDLIVEELELSKDTALELRMLPETRRIDLLVKDAYTSEPFGGVSLWMGKQNEQTDHKGETLFFSYEGGYAVRAEAARYYPDTFQVQVDGDTSMELKLWRSLADLKFVVKNNASYLNQALIKLAETSEYTSSIGVAYFSDLKTDSLYTYTIDHSETGIFMDSISLQTDSTLRINLGVNEVSQLTVTDLYIYPNPAGDKLKVLGLKGQTPFSIHGVRGEIVLQGRAGNKDYIDISGLKEGIHFLTPGDGSPLKFIKQ